MGRPATAEHPPKAAASGDRKKRPSLIRRLLLSIAIRTDND